MSNTVNDNLLDRASDMVDYWSGTIHAKLILKALDSNDLDELKRHVAIAEKQAANQELGVE